MVVLQDYYNVYLDYIACVYQVSLRLVAVSVSYMSIYIPIIMYGLRLFIIVLQELHVYNVVYMLISSEL